MNPQLGVVFQKQKIRLALVSDYVIMEINLKMHRLLFYI